MYFPHDQINAANCWGQLYRTVLAVKRITGQPCHQITNPVVVLRAPSGREFPFLPAPDYHDPTRYCLMTPFDTFRSYNSVMKAEFGDLYSEEVAEIPFLERHDVSASCEPFMSQDVKDTLWRQYLKKDVKNNYISHFFGEKSRRIRWTVQQYTGDTTDGMLTQEYIDHGLRVATNSEEMNHAYSIAAFAMNDGAFDPWDDRTTLMLAVTGYDVEKTTPVCFMALQIEQESLLCKRIAVSHDEEYKPYSLVAMANLTAIRYFAQSVNANRYKYLDLGTNFNTSGSYKDGFPHQSVPLYNFPAQDSLYELSRWINARSSYTVTTTAFAGFGVVTA